MVTKTSGLCKPVEMKAASSTDEVKAIYEEWVEGQGAEGIVVHSETRIISKVKPRHSVDAAVVGYTTSDNGLRDMMLAVRREDGCYQVFAHGSNGMTDEQIAEAGLQALKAWMQEIGLPLTITQLGATEDMIPGITEGTICYPAGYLNLTKSDVTEILKESM